MFSVSHPLSVELVPGPICTAKLCLGVPRPRFGA